VLLLNTDRKQTFSLGAGDRIAQLVLVEIRAPVPIEVQELGRSDRGEGGFGSTGA